MDKKLIQHLSCKTGTPLLQLTEWVEDWEANQDYEILAWGDYATQDISKVRRTSDDEIFGIGDETDEGIIKSFYISHNILWIRTEEKGGVLRLHEIEKIKERIPLFVTENNVNIYEGDDWFIVGISTDEWHIGKMEYKKEHIPNPDYKGKRFSTKEAANEYVLLNKPILSVKETAEYLVKNYTFLQSAVFVEMKLIELAKQKLNQ